MSEHQEEAKRQQRGQRSVSGFFQERVIPPVVHTAQSFLLPTIAWGVITTARNFVMAEDFNDAVQDTVVSLPSFLVQLAITYSLAALSGVVVRHYIPQPPPVVLILADPDTIQQQLDQQADQPLEAELAPTVYLNQHMG